MKKSDKIISIVVLSILFIIFIFFYAVIRNQRKGFSVKNSGQVGIVELNGMIISSDKVLGELHSYTKRRDIRCIVLRINSPGGDVAASQEIYAEVKHIRDSGIPIVASIGTAGASGAYLAALGATKIMANPGSVTGSIGVIIDVPVVVSLMKRLGVEIKVVKSGEYKDVGSPYRDFTEKDRAYLKSIVDDLQNQFVDVIVSERHLLKNDLLKLADGRIFTGYQALKLGLIDTLGTLEDAISLSCKLAGMSYTPETVISKKKKKSLLELLFTDIEEVASILTPVPSLKYLWK